jgi:Membrane bound O-acyl transferase family
MVWNGRWIGTHKQPKYILLIDVDSSRQWLPLPVNFSRPKSPRLIFIRNRILSLIKICIIYCLHHNIMEVPNGYFAPLSFHDFSISNQTYFRRLLPRSSSTLTPDFPTMRETQIRIYFVIYFVWFCYALYTFLYEVLAVVFVATGVDDPEDWPPFFGKLTEAYSIRNFWGKFWHKLIYRTYTSYGKVISINILRIPRKGILGRLFVNFFVFISSGIVHQVVTKHLGLTCGYWPEDIAFFLANFAAIILEMAVQIIFERICRIARWTCPDCVKIIVGYFWVFGFLFWSVPKLEYPKQLCRTI